MSGAAQCPICGGYHFHRPIVAEVVDVDSGEPRSEGTGVLVLSELYPLAQAQLLLRYWTGDLVEFAAPCLLSSMGFKLRGRVEYSVFGPPDTAGLVIGSLQVGEICAESPEVATSPVSWAPWAIDAGAPRFTLLSSERQADVHVELRFDPALFPERAEQTCRALREQLVREISGLAKAVKTARFHVGVTAVRPGALLEPTSV
jgi:phenylacetate-coenzyme A ligase PaaK-like adenylate-forming protein